MRTLKKGVGTVRRVARINPMPANAANTQFTVWNNPFFLRHKNAYKMYDVVLWVDKDIFTRLQQQQQHGNTLNQRACVCVREDFVVVVGFFIVQSYGLILHTSCSISFPRVFVTRLI